MSGKFSAPSLSVLFHTDERVADPKLIADVFTDNFASVSMKDPYSPMAAHLRHLERRGVNFGSADFQSQN